MKFYDKAGKQITLEQWVKLMHDFSYCRVASTKISPTLGYSTVWLGIDHSLESKMIFETAEITDQHVVLPIKRYSTLSAAKAGHNKFVAKAKTKDN